MWIGMRKTKGKKKKHQGAYLDLPKIDWFADELIVLGKLLAGRQLDEDLTQLSSITTERISKCTTISYDDKGSNLHCYRRPRQAPWHKAW